MADKCQYPDISEIPKKKKKHGRKWERNRNERISSHVIGFPCHCKRYKCFEETTVEEREFLLLYFNKMQNKDHQDSFLASMIKVLSIKRRRPRKKEEKRFLRDHSFSYYIKVARGNNIVRVPVCINAILSIFGIGKSRIERIRGSLVKTGVPPLNQQGKHTNRPLAFSGNIVNSIIDHIKSFKGRQSHYALHETRKLYLPEDLNLSKMYNMYKERFPQNKVCRESYRKIFAEKFNISFGYPRKDTCSTCDKLNIILENQDTAADHQIIKASHEKELHLRKAEMFYTRKREARSNLKTGHVALAFDFAKNMSCPNVSTNDVYYRRQLSMYTFNIHCLGSNSVHLFCYDETYGQKGADNVASMLEYYFEDIIPKDVSHLQLFCDSCAGQNKNWTVIRFLHFNVVNKKRFHEIKISFPIRGHSYMECDRDMVLVNQKVRAELPVYWMEEYHTCREKPSPFKIIKMELKMFFNFSDHMKQFYKVKCPIPTRPIREIIFSQDFPTVLQYRFNWNGPFERVVITKAIGKKKQLLRKPLTRLYNERLPISCANYADLQVLKYFCMPEAQQFFNDLPYKGQLSDDELVSELSKYESI
ncbi:uncharacterized protein LOC105846628 [Hydra vulgaris]|uniref:uncharacterized protein LOC105846628 n=1 Tax=Hydra vulgaris TaxID=6087 RepID=UPI0006410D70|nr:uncharacterized protein LOC105846628 [Hydra vulgaris]